MITTTIKMKRKERQQQTNDGNSNLYVAGNFAISFFFPFRNEIVHSNWWIAPLLNLCKCVFVDSITLMISAFLRPFSIQYFDIFLNLQSHKITDWKIIFRKRLSSSFIHSVYYSYRITLILFFFVTQLSVLLNTCCAVTQIAQMRQVYQL